MYILVYGWQKFPNSSRKPIKKFLHFKMSYTSICRIQNVRLQQHDQKCFLPWNLKGLVKMCPLTKLMILELPASHPQCDTLGVWRLGHLKPPPNSLSNTPDNCTTIQTIYLEFQPISSMGTTCPQTAQLALPGFSGRASWAVDGHVVPTGFF